MSHSGTPITFLDAGTLIRGWKILTAATLLGVVSGGVLLFSISPRQEVSAKLLIEQRGPVQDVRSSASRDKEFLPTQAEILSSPAVISGAISRLASSDPTAGSTVQTSAIAKQLKVDPLAGTNVLLLRYSDVTAQRAVEVADALISSYREYLWVADQQAHQRAQAALENQDASCRQQLSRLHEEYEQLVRQSADSAGSSADAAGRILAEIQSSLTAVQTRRLALERAAEHLRSHTDELNRRPSTASKPDSGDAQATVLSDTDDALLLSMLNDLRDLNPEPRKDSLSFSDLETELLAARRRLDELTIVLGERHPERIAASVALASCRDRIRAAVAAAPDVIANLLQTLDAEAAILQERSESQLTAIGEAEFRRVRQDRTLQEIERLQQVSRDLQARIQDLPMSETSADGSNTMLVTVLEPPVAAERTFVASPPIVIGICGLLGAMAGLVVLNGAAMLKARPAAHPAEAEHASTVVAVQESLV